MSHSSAARLWELLRYRGPRGPVHITMRGSARRRPDIRIHRVVELRTDEITRIERIPVATPARTLLDIAGTVSDRALERAMAEAFARHLATTDSVAALLERHPERRGVARVRALLRGSGPAWTQSHAEDVFLELVGKVGIDRPDVNVEVEGHLVDFLWPREGLVVEIDGFGPHSSRKVFKSDRSRDADLVGAGYRVLRVAWDSLVEEPEAVLFRLGKAMAAAPRR